MHVRDLAVVGIAGAVLALLAAGDRAAPGVAAERTSVRVERDGVAGWWTAAPEGYADLGAAAPAGLEPCDPPPARPRRSPRPDRYVDLGRR